ncbi:MULTISPECIES: hypothetical protein [unclassified Nocardioides]|uniref:hypothetical protein n=1 Tax=unclassified Nocardioides TaxID=2615069 RepID=UPI00115196B4|nr:MULTISPECIES: hypothetical protein [unclassified Nocardioides]TQK72114.1 hypothetical protein FBY23_3922 [Nocardioides sp. SLBN-35]WGY03676.1 hypothetical protein QI633_07895 [Nocardioides sp. QY071]
MSYDITLAARAPGQDWDDVLDALEQSALDDDVLPAERRAELVAVLDRIEGRLDGLLGGWSRFTPTDDGTLAGELSSAEGGVQVSLHDDSAFVTYPYWEQQDPAAFHAAVAEVVRVVADQTGYDAYDPQRGDSFDGTFDDGSGLDVVRRINAGEDLVAASPASEDLPPRTGRAIAIGFVVAVVILVLVLLVS